MSHNSPNIDPSKFEYHEHEARALLGKTVIIGVTEQTRDRKTVARRQFMGTVERVSPKGIEVRLTTSGPDDPLLWLPPAPRCFEPAPPGLYTMRSTGEVAENPDYTTAWFRTVDPAPNAAEDHDKPAGAS